MASGSDWSRAEVEATVSSYFEMLALELRGKDYTKAEYRRRLQPLLEGRTEGAIEYKYQNVSAVLLDIGFPYVEGYKPARNYQRLLYDVVSERLEGDRRLQEIVARQVEKPAEVPTVDDVLAALVEAPTSGSGEPAWLGRETSPPRPTVDYLRREARNGKLGRAGEQFVVRFEEARLAAAGEERRAAEIEHVSETRGDHLGFDVLSFEPDGRERLIEVKTTAFGRDTPFYLSRNQLEVSRRERDRYHLYRLFRFRAAPKLFSLRGALDDVCRVDPVEYLGRAK